MSIETWRTIPGYEGLYEVSDQGRVRSLERVTPGPKPMLRRERMMKLYTDVKGYKKVQLSRLGHIKAYGVHQLVVLSFVGPRPDEMEVCHSNGQAGDNRLENLRYDTRSGNAQDTIAHGRHPEASKTHCIHGHPFSPENTRIDTAGKRVCRTCKKATNARRAKAPEDRRRFYKVSAAQIEQMVELRESGLPLRVIAEQFDVHHSTVSMLTRGLRLTPGLGDAA